MFPRFFRKHAQTLPSTPSPKKSSKIRSPEMSTSCPEELTENEDIVVVPEIDELNSNVQDEEAIILESKEKNQFICERILEYCVLSFLEWKEIGKLIEINQIIRTLCESDMVIAPGFWRAICKSLGREVTLYVPENPLSIMLSSHAQHTLNEQSNGSVWKRFFFENLWSARGKWGTGGGSLSSKEGGSNNDFKINVCIRFRPLERPKIDDKLGLPLHQYIKLKRQQAKQSSGGGGQNHHQITVGSQPPKHLLDGIFGVLLKDPVKLPSSGIIVERKTAEENIKQRGKDLLDDTPLQISELIEMPELKLEAHEWREKMLMDDGDIDRIQRSVIVRDLVDTNSGLPPEVIEALVEAERIAALSKRAEVAAREGESSRLNETDHNDEAAAEEDPTHISAASVTEGLPSDSLLNTIDDNQGGELSEGKLNEELSIDDQLTNVDKVRASNYGGERRRDLPRVLGLQPSRVVMFVPGHGVRPFNFGRVLESDQERCYQSFARPSVVALLNGFNASLFCYGQTGGGKSHTIFGPSNCLEENNVVRSSGLVVRVLDELISGAHLLNIESKGKVSVTFSAQYVEIYNDEMIDLLTGNPCEVLRSGETNSNISGAVDCPITSLNEGILLLRAGQVRKRIAQTAMNDRSSRAHSIFLIKMRQCRGDDVITATLQMVDLAGSERLKKSKAEGTAKLEAVGINESLLVLGKVISALVESKSHVPYFETKLTTLLKSALGGASRTTVTPSLSLSLFSFKIEPILKLSASLSPSGEALIFIIIYWMSDV